MEIFIFYYGFGRPDVPTSDSRRPVPRGVRMSRHPDVRMLAWTSGRPDVRSSGCPDVQTSRSPDVQMSGCLDVWTSGPRPPDVRTSEHPHVRTWGIRTSGRPDVQKSRLPDIWDIQTSRCPGRPPAAPRQSRKRFKYMWKDVSTHRTNMPKNVPKNVPKTGAEKRTENGVVNAE